MHSLQCNHGHPLNIPLLIPATQRSQNPRHLQNAAGLAPWANGETGGSLPCINRRDFRDPVGLSCDANYPSPPVEQLHPLGLIRTIIGPSVDFGIATGEGSSQWCSKLINSHPPVAETHSTQHEAIDDVQRLVVNVDSPGF